MCDHDSQIVAVNESNTKANKPDIMSYSIFQLQYRYQHAI